MVARQELTPNKVRGSIRAPTFETTAVCVMPALGNCIPDPRTDERMVDLAQGAP